MHKRLLFLHAAQLPSMGDISLFKSKEPSNLHFFYCKEATTVPFNRQVTTAKLLLQALQLFGKHWISNLTLFFFIFWPCNTLLIAGFLPLSFFISISSNTHIRAHLTRTNETYISLSIHCPFLKCVNILVISSIIT